MGHNDKLSNREEKSKSELKKRWLFNQNKLNNIKHFQCQSAIKSLLYSHNKHYYTQYILNSKNYNCNRHSSPKNFVFPDKFSLNKPNQFQIYFDHCTAVQEN